MTKNIFSVMVGSLCALALTLSSCGSIKLPPISVPLSLPTDISVRSYNDLDKPINVSVTSASVLNDYDLVGRTVNFVPSIANFANDATDEYMRQMRFDIAYSADIRMNIELKNFEISISDDKKHYDCTVRIAYSVVNEAGESIVTTRTSNGNVSMPIPRLGLAEKFEKAMGEGMSRAYIEALRKINWDKIADCLRVAKSPKQEKNAQVSGAGDTALEHSVIRWYILSTPQGADVSWRVISSTPDVANTNSNFVGTTPYESTESFDIKGLTYNNSGNVQIEVSCEKPGYLTQRKRFNLRQAIDQKEISAKFNLIKDE
ncbi:MAG: hypothetical protein HDS04_03785 [Bacteroides sp.]|nr:hypothetical protein [Bacteroides sp.]